MQDTQKHVVLLDDDTAILRSVERLLHQKGFRVTATDDPKRAMEVVVSEPTDAIVSDLYMPQMSGHLVLSLLTQAAPFTARVLMTAERDLAKMSSLMVPYSVHAIVAKQDLGERLHVVLDELCAERPDALSGGEVHPKTLARTIIRSLSMRKYETLEHCERMAAWGRRLAMQMRLSPERVVDVELGALLHDIGQIGIPDAILLKPGALTEAEWQELRRHPDLGASLLAEIPGLRRAIPIVQCHHERRDGKGYPRGLVGNAIPLDARVFQVVDAYEAMTTDRPHRKGRSPEEARRELTAHVGPQFDPEVVEAWCTISLEEWSDVISPPKKDVVTVPPNTSNSRRPSGS